MRLHLHQSLNTVIHVYHFFYDTKVTTYIIAGISETFGYPPFWCEKGKNCTIKVLTLTLGGHNKYFCPTGEIILPSINATALITLTQLFLSVLYTSLLKSSTCLTVER